jgi:hypothetical protein
VAGPFRKKLKPEKLKCSHGTEKTEIGTIPYTFGQCKRTISPTLTVEFRCIQFLKERHSKMCGELLCTALLHVRTTGIRKL